MSHLLDTSTLLWSIRSLARLMWKMAEWQLAGWKGGILGQDYKEYAGYNRLLLSVLLSNGIIDGREARANGHLPWFTKHIPSISLRARGSESTSRSLNERLPHVKQSVVIERGATAVVMATAVTYVWLDEVVSEDAEKSLLAKASICAGNTNKDIRFTPIAQGFLCHEYSLWVLTFYYSIVKDFSKKYIDHLAYLTLHAW